MLVFPITSYPWRAFAAITAVLVVLPIVVIALLIAAAGTLPGWLWVTGIVFVLALLLSVNVGLIALAVFVATRNEITVRRGTMHLKGGEFHARVPLEAVTGVEVIDLADRPALARARRRNAVVLPGFRVGWFQTADERWVFVLRGGQHRLVYVETDQHFSALLGVQEPSALRDQLLSPETMHRH